MNPLVENLLQPISDSDPCGPDLSYDPRFDELETILKGKPEVEMGSVVKPAEPPDWGQLKDRSVEFLGASKHLRAAVMLCASLIKTDGLPGLRDGLQLLRGLLERYWGTVHPRLDPDDGNDPVQRLNILGAITAPRSAYGLGWLQVVDLVATAPLCRPSGAPAITMDDVLAAAQPREQDASGNLPAGPDAATIALQFGGVAPDDLAATQAAIAEALEALEGIDAFLTNTLGSTNAISFDELRSILEQVERVMAANQPGAGEAVAASGDGAAGIEAAPAAAGGVAVSADAIRSRGDVVRVLEKVCDYYRQFEPGSPVPYLLRRAQKMAGMTFFEAVQELNIATAETLRPAMGSALDSELPPAG